MKGRENLDYVLIERKQTIKVPVNIWDVLEIHNTIKECEMFDTDIFDWDKEEVVEEDYSLSVDSHLIIIDGVMKYKEQKYDSHSDHICKLIESFREKLNN